MWFFKKILFIDNAKYIQILVNWHDKEYDHGFQKPNKWMCNHFFCDLQNVNDTTNSDDKEYYRFYYIGHAN